MLRKTCQICVVVGAVVGTISVSSTAEETPPEPISFVRDVAPILVGKCQACHGPKTAESNYRLDTFDLLMQPGDFESPPVTAAELEQSEIYRLITSDDAEERMPNNGDRLTDAEITAIKSWILEGAKFDGTDAAAPLLDQIPRGIPHPAAPATYPSTIPITALAFSADGNQLLVGGYHEVLIWEPTSGTLITRVGNIPQRTFGLAFSPDSSKLAVAGGAPGVSGEVRLIPWENGPRGGAEPTVLATQEDVFFDVAFSPDGTQLAACGADGSVRLFDVATGNERLKIENHADWVFDVCFSPDGSRIATASRDKSSKVFDVQSGALITTNSEHQAPVRAVAFSPDGKHVISAGGNRIRVWNAEDAAPIGDVVVDNEIHELLINGETIIAVSEDSTARQYELADRTLIRKFDHHPVAALSLAWHVPTSRIAVGPFDGVVTVWNLDGGTMVKQFFAAPSTAKSAN